MNEVQVLGRWIRWTSKGLGMEVDVKHRKRFLEHFGFDDTSRSLAASGDKEKSKG